MSVDSRRLVSVLACSLNQIPGDLSHNVGNIVNAIKHAVDINARIVLTPELSIIGYGVEDMVLDLSLAERAARALFVRILPLTRERLVVVGLPVFHRQALYNGAAVCYDGNLMGIVFKKNLAQDGPLYEARHYKAWSGGHDTWTYGDRQIPLGSLLFNIDGLVVGVEMCEEAWVTDRAGVELVKAGAKVILNPSCSPYYSGKRAVRDRIAIDLSGRGHCAYIYASQMGVGGGTVPSDPYASIAAGGRMITPSPDMYFGEAVYAEAMINVGALDRSAAQCASFQRSTTTDFREVGVRSGCNWIWTVNTGRRIAKSTPQPAAWRNSGEPEQQQLIELFHMLAMCCFWYLVRSRQQGWLLPLSGGRDSALVLAIISRGLDLAHEELGWKELIKTLAHIRGLDSLDSGDLTALKKRLIHTCFITGEASSANTQSAARILAADLYANHLELSSVPLYQAAHQTLVEQTGATCDWSNPGDVVPLENLATGARFLLARFLANSKGLILLVTANLTEMAEGYYTIGADANGGYAPLTSLDKVTVMDLLLQLRLGWVKFAPICGISTITSAGPATAELQPGAMGQTDEGFMGPFPVLTVMIDLLLGQHWSVNHVYWEVKERFPQHQPWEIFRWLERLCLRWSNSQFKRYQACPGPRLSTPDLMSQVGNRYPIISDGFKEDLAELVKDIEAVFGPAPPK